MKTFKEIESPMVEETQSFKIYFQISTVKVNETGFWDTIKEINEKDMLQISDEWDKLAVEYLDKGFRVRLLGERFTKISSYTEIILRDTAKMARSSMPK